MKKRKGEGLVWRVEGKQVRKLKKMKGKGQERQRKWKKVLEEVEEACQSTESKLKKELAKTKKELN